MPARREIVDQALQPASGGEVEMQRGAAGGLDAIAQRGGERIDQAAFDALRGDEQLAIALDQ